MTPIWVFAACGELLPDELVIGADVAALVVEGEAGSEFGAGVALSPSGILVGSPGAGVVDLLDLEGSLIWRVQGGPRFGREVFWSDGGEALAWEPGVGVFLIVDGERTVIWSGTAQDVDVGPDGVVFVEDAGERVSVSSAGVLETSCDDASCEVLLDGTLLGTTSPGSDVGWLGDLPCWGDASLEVDPSPGGVICFDGGAVDGLDGDHLGASLGGGWAAGVFNKWQVPARLRVVPLGGGVTWALDRAAERSGAAVDADADRVVLGTPGFARTEPEQGRIYIVER